jgi:hypothetical protein
MDDRDERDEGAAASDRREQRMMWIFSAVIVLVIAGGMGANMLFHKQQPASDNTEISSQSRVAPAQ